MINSSIKHECLVVLDAFSYKELVQTIITCFKMNELSKVARIPKRVVLTNSKASMIDSSVKHECPVVLDVLFYTELV